MLSDLSDEELKLNSQDNFHVISHSPLLLDFNHNENDHTSIIIPPLVFIESDEEENFLFEAKSHSILTVENWLRVKELINSKFKNVSLFIVLIFYRLDISLYYSLFLG